MRCLQLAGKGTRIFVWRMRHYGVCVTWTWLWTRIFMWSMGREVWRYCQVTPQLYVGGQMRSAGWRWMVRRGITGVLNLRENHDDRVHGVPSDAYLWLPTRDDHAPAIEDLRRGVTFISLIVQQGGKVYVHCASGVGRAPTMAAAYLTSSGLTPEQAIGAIQRVRPFIKPTPPQMEVLKRYAVECVGADTGCHKTRHWPTHSTSCN
jgi:protein tyrosine phosphatase (PTP) superfamily phosphohydrolase (DUF442 family)